MSSEDKKKITDMIATKVANKLTLKINSGTTEGTNLYTYDGSSSKTLNFKPGTGIGFTTAAGAFTISNSGVRSVTTGDNNGTIKVNTNGTNTNVAVKGLGSAAYTNSSDYSVSKALTAEDLDDVIIPGFYNSGGGNTVTNKPSGVDHFGLEVIHGAGGAYYVQILFEESFSNVVWRRHCQNGTWSAWTKDNYTDTHWTSHLYVGAKSSNNSNASNAATTNGNTYLKLFDDSTLRHQYNIKGTGNTTVTSDASGNIVVNSPTTLAWSSITGKPSMTDYVTVASDQTITGSKTFTNKLKIQDGDASGSFVLGADVNAKTVTANVRKLGRMGVPSYDSTTKTVAGISFDSQANANYADFGGHPNNASSIAPDVIRFVVANTHDNTINGARTLALQISKQNGLVDTSAGGTSVASAKFFIPVEVTSTIHAGDTITSDKGFVGDLKGNASSATNAANLGGQAPSYYASAESLKKYLPLAGGSMDDNASLKFCMYGNRYLTINGNSIAADMSNCNGGWAGAFASVKHKDPNSTAEDGTTVTTMLGWYGGATNLTHIFMGGTYSSPAMKMTPAGIFTFKNAIVGSITGEAGSVEWSNVKNKPTTFTPGDHTHATNKITASTGYSKATSASAIATTDSLNTALGKLEYKADLGKTAYDWYKSVTDTDTDTLINKWGEIVGFLDSVAEGTDILDEFVTRKTDQTITGKKIFNTNTNSKPLVISRTGGTTEAVSIGVNDSQAIFEYVNDEKSNAFVFKLINNDSESSDGSGANTNTVTFTGSSSGSTVAATTFQGRLAYTYLTGSGTTKDQAIVSSGTANGWTLKTLGSHAFDSTAYLPLAGGQMNSTAFIAWNSGAGGNDLADWSITDNGLRIISSIATTSNAPTQYATGLHVKGRYGFQIASQGGDTSNAFFIKNVHNTTWNTLLHSNNYTTYVSTTNFPGLNKTGTVTSVTVKGANGLSGSGTVTTSGTITLSNAGVRSATISGDYLKVNTNGTDANLTIPYATASSYLKVTACRGGGSNSKLWDDPVVDAQKVKVWDVYTDDGPSSYGNILEINGITNHWKPQLWFDSGTGQMRVRNRSYNVDEWNAWRIVLDSVNYTSYTPILNSATTHATSSSVIYAPTTAGTLGHILTSNGSGAPIWTNPANIAIGTASNGVFYIEGTGSTAGTWLGSHTGITSYYKGLTIAYKIPVKGADTTTLNINSLGAVTIRRNDSALTTHVPVNSVIVLVYDGTYFRWSDYDANSYAYVRQYITDSTNEEYPLLFRYDTADPSSTYVTKYTRFDSAITVNPSTNTITATSFKGNLIGTAADSDKLGGSAATNYLLKSDLATQELTSNLTTITKSLTVTAAWMDTGISGANIPKNGTYIVQVSSHNSTDSLWYCYWSGIMSWYKDGTNDADSDEIILHRSGHAYNNTIYLRTVMQSNGVLKLQIAANKTLTTAATYTFKFKQII